MVKIILLISNHHYYSNNNPSKRTEEGSNCSKTDRPSINIDTEEIAAINTVIDVYFLFPTRQYIF